MSRRDTDTALTVRPAACKDWSGIAGPEVNIAVRLDSLSPAVLGPLRSPAASRRAPFLGAILATTALVAGGLVAPAAHGATVDSDRAQIAQIQKQIAAKGAEIESLVSKANEARAHLDALHVQIGHDEELLASDTRLQRKAETLVRKAAVVAYVGRGSGGGPRCRSSRTRRRLCR